MQITASHGEGVTNAFRGLHRQLRLSGILELHKIYRVLPDKEAEEDGDIRIVDESGEDYLFEADRFCPCTCRRRPCVSSTARSPASLL